MSRWNLFKKGLCLIVMSIYTIIVALIYFIFSIVLLLAPLISKKNHLTDVDDTQSRFFTDLDKMNS